MYNMDRQMIEHKLNKYREKMEQDGGNQMYVIKIKKYEKMRRRMMGGGEGEEGKGVSEEIEGPLARQSREILNNVKKLHSVVMPKDDHSVGLFESKLFREMDKLDKKIKDIHKQFDHDISKYEYNRSESERNVRESGVLLEQIHWEGGKKMNELRGMINDLDTAYAFYGVMNKIDEIWEGMRKMWEKSGRDDDDYDEYFKVYFEKIKFTIFGGDILIPYLVPKDIDDEIIKKFGSDDLTLICKAVWRNILAVSNKITVKISAVGRREYVFLFVGENFSEKDSAFVYTVTNDGHKIGQHESFKMQKFTDGQNEDYMNKMIKQEEI